MYNKNLLDSAVSDEDYTSEIEKVLPYSDLRSSTCLRTCTYKENRSTKFSDGF